VKRSLNTTASIPSITDFNRDGRINALDLSIVKRNLNHSLPLFAGAAPAPALWSGAGVITADDVESSNKNWDTGLLR